MASDDAGTLRMSHVTTWSTVWREQLLRLCAAELRCVAAACGAAVETIKLQDVGC
jgi:hypothetical protein